MRMLLLENMQLRLSLVAMVVVDLDSLSLAAAHTTILRFPYRRSGDDENDDCSATAIASCSSWCCYFIDISISTIPTLVTLEGCPTVLQKALTRHRFPSPHQRFELWFKAYEAGIEAGTKTVLNSSSSTQPQLNNLFFQSRLVHWCRVL